ncbi:MAG TPA: hypothetical protein VKY29_01475, partial [Cryomorphaceae bacterium]|nr:hypothetical protein [Cryomorphaceae bacterium]
MKTDVTSRVHGNVVPRGNSVCCSALTRLRSVALFLTIMLTAGMAFGQSAVREATQHAAYLSQIQEPVVIVKHEPYPGPDVVPAEVQAMMANHTQSSITPMNDPAPVIDHCPEDRVVECFSDVGHTVGELEYSIFCGPAALIIVYEPAGILETGSCPGTEYTVTYAVWDQCGSHTTCDQIFTLDNAGPQITFCPEG